MKDLMGRTIWDYYYQENLKIYKPKLLSQNWMICQFLIFSEIIKMNALEKKALDLSL